MCGSIEILITGGLLMANVYKYVISHSPKYLINPMLLFPHNQSSISTKKGGNKVMQNLFFCKILYLVVRMRVIMLTSPVINVYTALNHLSKKTYHISLISSPGLLIFSSYWDREGTIRGGLLNEAGLPVCEFSTTSIMYIASK